MKRILVAPLDWGLGHATRCIPLIRELQRQDCDIVIGGSGDSLTLLQKEFPHIPRFSLPAYNPRYPVNGSMALAMMTQLPHFCQVILGEHRAVAKIINDEKIDIVISDNRFGCWSKRIPSVFITHQSNIMMPQRFGFLQNVVRKLNERLMNCFQFCWIPDFPDEASLAGELIAFGTIATDVRTEFIGWLSRFQNEAYNQSAKYNVIAVLSGPEPQRTLLERAIVPQLRTSGLKYVVVRGLPSAEPSENEDGIVNFLGARDLGEYIASSEIVIARSGYSTVMDLMALGSKAIFVPTPGQTEQEYLSAKLMSKGIAFAMSQDRFDLATAMKESKNYRGFERTEKNDLLTKAIHKLLQYHYDFRNVG